MHIIGHSRSRVNGKMGLAQIIKEAWSGVQTDPKQIKVLVLGCTKWAEIRE